MVATGIGAEISGRRAAPVLDAGRRRSISHSFLGPPVLARFAAEVPELDLDIVAPGPGLMEALESDAVVGVIARRRRVLAVAS